MTDKYSRVCALIDLNNIYDNMNQICSKVSDNCLVYAVIKADGYGHGAVMLAKEYEKIPKVKGFCVATAEEALQLIDANIKKEILIIGYTFPYSYKKLIENDIRITVFRRDMLEQINDAAVKIGKKAYVHIKVDTGMGRIGIDPFENGVNFVKEALTYENIEVEGIFTHFSRADEKDKSNTNSQYDLFDSFISAVESENDFKFKVKHCSNSAAILDLPFANMDAVRAGIILYGLWPSEDVDKNSVKLKPAMSLISHISFIKNIAPGTAISYGGDYVAERPMRIATVPVGYADGYQRRLSNKAYVLIHGKKAPVLGRICMDQFMVDITFIPECEEGDEVTLIGKNGDLVISVEDLSSISEQLNYEFVCDIGKRVPRRYIKDGEYIEAN